MIIPTLLKNRFIDKEGFLTSEAQEYQDQLNIQMQKNLSDDGLVIPSKTTDEINHIADPTTENFRPNGTMWYDSTTNQFKGKINGLVKIFTLT